jgi:predicted sulfurtransferase
MRLISSSLAIGILGLVVLTACNSAEQKTMGSKPVAATNPAATAPSDGVRRVTPAELHDLLAKNQAVVIDVRNEASYNAGHIRGARLIPEAEVANHASELPKDKLIVTYCS